MAAFPAPSAALQVIVVTPIGKVETDTRLAVGEETQVAVTGEVTASVVVTEKVTGAPKLDVASMTWLAGTVMTGAVRS